MIQRNIVLLLIGPSTLGPYDVYEPKSQTCPEVIWAQPGPRSPNHLEEARLGPYRRGHLSYADVNSTFHPLCDNPIYGGASYSHHPYTTVHGLPIKGPEIGRHRDPEFHTRKVSIGKSSNTLPPTHTSTSYLHTAQPSRGQDVSGTYVEFVDIGDLFSIRAKLKLTTQI